MDLAIVVFPLIVAIVIFSIKTLTTIIKSINVLTDNLHKNVSDNDKVKNGKYIKSEKIKAIIDIILVLLWLFFIILAVKYNKDYPRTSINPIIFYIVFPVLIFVDYKRK